MNYLYFGRYHDQDIIFVLKNKFLVECFVIVEISRGMKMIILTKVKGYRPSISPPLGAENINQARIVTTNSENIVQVSNRRIIDFITCYAIAHIHTKNNSMIILNAHHT